MKSEPEISKIDMQVGPGPVTWMGILTATCLELLLFSQILWLVIPLLIALVLYYLLSPVAKRMVLAGFSKDFSAAILSLSLVLILGGWLMLLYPWALANAEGWQATFLRYLSGGYDSFEKLLDHTQAIISPAATIHWSETLHFKFLQFQEHFTEEYLFSFLAGLGAWLPPLLLVPFVTYFLLKEGSNFRKFLGSAVPNAYFEKTLYLSYAIDRTVRSYFLGLVKLALLDALVLSAGCAVLGLSFPILMGTVAAFLGQVPYLGPLASVVMVIIITGTDFPGNLHLIYSILLLFITVRLLDDFVFIPMVVGKSLRLHPLLSLLMLLVGGVIAGVAGLMLVLPVLGITLLLGETLEIILTDNRLFARHEYALKIKRDAARVDLV